MSVPRPSSPFSLSQSKPAQDAETLSCHLQWTNRHAIQYLERAKQLFGVPSTIAPQKGGYASWVEDKLDGSPFYEVRLYDKNMYSEFLKSRVFWSVSIKFQVVDDCLKEVLSMCDNLSYCPIERTLTATADDQETCAAILMTGTAVGNKIINKNLVEHKDLIRKNIVLAKAKKNRDIIEDQISINMRYSLGTYLIVTLREDD